MSTINFIVLAFDDSIDKLENTIQSIALCKYEQLCISVVTNSENIDKATEILNKNEELCLAPLFFNKFPFGVPTFCLGFEKGKIRNCDALNSLIRASYEYCDIFVFIQSGDIVLENYPKKIIEALNEGVGMVGVIYGDYIIDNIPIYSEPFSRDKMINTWYPYGYTIPKYVLESEGLFPNINNTENIHLLKILDKYMAIHIPEFVIQK